MIRCPCGSPSCCVVRSASVGVISSSPSSGPVTSVSRCGSRTSGCFGWRSAVERYPSKSSGGCTPAAGRSYDGRTSLPASAAARDARYVSGRHTDGSLLACPGSARSASSSAGVGAAMISGSAAMARSQPVRSLAAEADTPGYRPVRVNSSVSGSGSRTPRSVMIFLGPAPVSPSRSRSARARPVADRGDEVDPFDERAVVLPDHDDHLTARGGDLRRAARAGQPHLGVTVIPADHGGVDVAELVDLGGAEEADVDAAGLQPVVEDLRDADHRVRRLGQHAVADGQRQPVRLGADRARLVDQHQRRRVRGPGQVRGRAGQPDADETGHAVAQRPGGGHRHHLVRGVGHRPAPHQSSSSHRVKVSRSLAMASQAT